MIGRFAAGSGLSLLSGGCWGGIGGDGRAWRGDSMSSEVGLLGGSECWDGSTVCVGGCWSCSGYRRCAVSFPMFAGKGVQYYLPAYGAACSR